MERGGYQFHHRLLLQALGSGLCVALRVERPAVVACPGETPAISGLVDVRLFGAGPYHLLRCFQNLIHFSLRTFPHCMAFMPTDYFQLRQPPSNGVQAASMAD